MSIEVKPLQAAPTDLPSITQQESTAVLSSFTAIDAFNLGIAVHSRIQALYPGKAAVVNISHANSQLLFHACTASGVSPDNDIWVSRKRRTVMRFGSSSWYMGRKFEGDEGKFADKYGLGTSAGDYAIHGGAVPIRVKGVEGVVGVLIVSGLKQDEDHQIAIEALQNF